MEIMVGIVTLPLLLVGLFCYGVVRGRPGLQKHQHLAFYGGLVGLAALPVWLLATGGLFTQLMWATFASVSGIAWIAASAGIAGAAVCVARGLWR